MRFDETGLEATHEEVLTGIKYYVRSLGMKGHTPKEAQLAGYFIGRFFEAWPGFIEALKGKRSDKCPKCNGTGKSQLVLAGSEPINCNACDGTGIQPIETKQEGEDN